MTAIPSSKVVWYVTGRFYASTDGSIFDVGYFLHLQGVTSPLFQGAPGEGTALLTFAAVPFQAENLDNGDLQLAVDPVGEFSLYLNREGQASFDDPSSFSKGEEIARFRRASIVVGVTAGSTALNVFSADLVSSREFELGGQRHDLRRLIPHGVTQWGTASTTPAPAPPGFSRVLPFVGSAIAIGS